MNPHRQEIFQIVIGAIVSCVIVGCVALIFGPDRLINDGRYELQATFGKVDGLKIGGKVVAAGVPVGEVVAMELTEDFRARTVFRVDRNVQLDVNSSVAVVTDGLFGDKFVRLDIGGADEMIPSGGVIGRTEDPVIIDDLLKQIIRIGEEKQRARAGR